MAGRDLHRDSAIEADAGSTEAPDIPVPGVRRSRWWRLRRIALWTLAGVVSLALLASGVVVWSVRSSFPEYGGTLTLPGLDGPVTVYRDAYGVPQVYASSETDLFRAQGYVTAQDRFWEMDFRRHVTSGRLAELFGPAMVPTDAFLRTLGWRQVAEREWQLISPQARRYLRAYAAGVNAWIADNGGAAPSDAKGFEYAIVGLDHPGYTVQRWDPIDSLAWLKAMAWDLRGNMHDEMSRALLLASGLSREEISQLYPPYPFARNHPIVDRGAVADGAFDADADAGDGTRPAAGRVEPASADRRTWRDARPVLGALSDAMRALSGLLGVEGRGVGSNSWVVSGSLTATGKPLLANDPHLAPSMPGIWYQVGLHCSCAYNVTGFSLAGIPGVVIGHNARIAWGLTNLGPDVTDLYLEKLKGDRYLDGTGWRKLALRREVIKVAGGKPVTITVRATEHGPLLSDRAADLLGVAARPPVDGSGSPRQRVAPGPIPSLDMAAPGVPARAAREPYGVALRWTALDPGRTVEAIFALNTAADWNDFRAATALFDVPAQNMIYADVAGNIGYQAPGRIPIRAKGDGTWPVPGWDPAYTWDGYIPFDELPNMLNPPGGVIVTANQAVIGPEYPYLITRDWAYGYRSQRISDMIADLAADRKLEVADMRRIQVDSRDGFAPVLVPALLEVPLGTGAEGAAARKARGLLKGWDFQQPADTPTGSSAAAAFYNATWRHLLLRTFDEVPNSPDGGARWWEVVRPLLDTPDSPWWDDRSTATTESRDDMLAAAMTDATAELTERLGDDPAEWRWGDLHTLTLRHAPLGESGIAPLEWLFNRGPQRVSGGVAAVNATHWYANSGYEVVFVPSMRMIVDMSDLDGSRWVQLTGNSGHAFHANYTDQMELWRTGKDTPMRWTRASIEATAEDVLVFEPTRAG